MTAATMPLQADETLVDRFVWWGSFVLVVSQWLCALVLAWGGAPDLAASQMALALITHRVASVYLGGFSVLRSWVWCGMIALTALAFTGGFLGYVLPVGQIAAWGATSGAGAFLAGSAPPLILPALASLVLLADILLMHARWLRRCPVAVLVIVFIAIAIQVGWAVLMVSSGPPMSSAAPDLLTPAHIVPEWYNLPFYATLRAMPGKLFGVVMAFAMLAAFFLVPWMQGERLRHSRRRWLWQLTIIAWMAVSAALAWYGAQDATDDVILISQGLVVLWFILFPLAPFLLNAGLTARPGSGLAKP